MKTLTITLRFPLVLGLLACGSEAGSEPRGMAFDSADIRVVENRESRWGPGEGWMVNGEPALVMGASLNGEGTQLVNVSDATRLSDGSIVLADAGTRWVSRFEPGGSPQKRLGGRGSGPGEFESPASLTRTTGDTVAVWDSQLFRVTRFEPSGEVVEVASLDLAGVSRAVEPPLYPGSVEPLKDGTFLVRLTEKTAKATPGGTHRPGSGALRVSGDLSVLDTLAFFGDSAKATVDAPFGSWAINLPLGPTTVLAHGGPHDRICVGDQEEAEIRCMDPDGSQTLLRWQARARPLTDGEIADWREAHLENFGQKLTEGDIRRMLEQVELPPSAPPYQDILLDEEGNLWVGIGPAEVTGGGGGFAGEAQAAGTFLEGAVRYLVFDADGVLLGSVLVPRMEVLEVGSDYVMGIHEDELGLQSLRVYPLEKAPAGGS